MEVSGSTRAVTRSGARRLAAAVLAVGALTASAAPARAQQPERRGRLVVTVVDQSGAVIRGAAVAVAPQEATTPSDRPFVSATDEVGVAIFPGLAEGRYTVQAEYEGFEMSVVRDVRVRGAETRRRIALPIKKLAEAVTVERDRQTSGLDPRGSAFSTVLTREQIDALPDDPDELEAALKAMAPPGSVIRVDGFTGGKLPPKSQIRSIRLPRMDMFAAQNHGGMAGVMFIDIMTMPGNGPLRGNVDVHLMDEALNARNAFTPHKADEQLRQVGYGLSGAIRPNRTAFSVNGGASTQFTSPNLFAVLPDGSTVTETLRQPRDTFTLNVRLDHAITREHALRLSFDRDTSRSRNMGVGGYNLFDRAYDTESAAHLLRFSENGPIGRRLFTETRLQVKWTSSESRSAVEAPTIRVQDAFTSGGAQQRGGQRATELEFATDLDYVRGAHSWRTGLLVEGGWYRSDDTSNYVGTYTFASLADYLAGRPSAYTRRVGDPDLSFGTLQAAGYLQDDYRVSRNVLVSPGVRVGVQAHVADRWNLSPRMSAAWSPFRNGRVTIRGSYGYFYEWIAGDLYKQAQLVDGVRQRELNISAPAYPDPGDEQRFPPTNQYLWSEDLDLPNAHRMTVGIERTLTQNSRLAVNYSRGWGRGLLRGRNLNAPVGGVRPDPALANRVELVSDASSRSQSLSLFFNIVRLDLKRTFFTANYTWSRTDTNTTGGFAIPASGDRLDSEWGPAASDIRHRAAAALSTSPFRNLSVGLTLRAQSGLPYTVTTGRDDNADGVFNDRPAGVSRNSARGAAQVDLGGRVSYAWGFGEPRQGSGPAGGQIVINAGGGGLAPGFSGGAADKRYRLEFYVSAQNVLNRANYTAYSYVMTSPFFGRAIAASLPRKLQMGVRFGF